MDELWISVIALIVMLAVGIPLAWLGGAVSCSSRAEKMGFSYDYGLIQGCMVKAPRGWIPIEGVRDID